MFSIEFSASLGEAHEAISADMLHAQEKNFHKGVAHGKWLLKAQFDNATDLTNKIKHLEYIIGYYEPVCVPAPVSFYRVWSGA